MRTLTIILLLSVTLVNGYGQQQKISIEAFATSTISDSTYEQYAVRLIRPSHAIEVAVISKASGRQIRGFGLGRRAKETIQVDRGNALLLTAADQPTDLKYEIIEGPSTSIESVPASTNRYINLTLHNGSLKSIPLIIPTVMNPNLSPMSNSGVSLKIGQEILFRYKGKRRVLLTVTDELVDGDTIEIAALLKARKKEIREGGS
jgi:hypothetical protein